MSKGVKGHAFVPCLSNRKQIVAFVNVTETFCLPHIRLLQFVQFSGATIFFRRGGHEYLKLPQQYFYAPY